MWGWVSGDPNQRPAVEIELGLKTEDAIYHLLRLKFNNNHAAGRVVELHEADLMRAKRVKNVRGNNPVKMGP